MREASAAQRRFWFLHQLDAGDATALTLSVCVRLDGAVDLDRLATGLRAVIARHEVLRSAYRWEHERLIAEILPVEAIEIVEIGSRQVAQWSERAVLDRAQELANQPFDIARGPLLRATLVAQGPTQSFLLLDMHHLVWDAWSFGVLLRDLSAAYAHGPDGLDELPAQYWDYVERQRALIERGGWERDIDYWRRQLADLHDLPHLSREPGGDEQAGTIHKLSVDFGSALREQVATYCRRYSVTPFAVFSAALQALLYRLGLGERSALGVPLADRADPSFEGLIGCFLNTVVLGGEVGEYEQFDKAVATAGERTFEALQHGALPFEIVSQQIAPERDLASAPFHQALLIFQNTPQRQLELAGVSASTYHVPHMRGQIEPAFTVWFEHPELVVDLEWSGELVVPAERLLECWRALLGGGLRQPLARIDELPLTVDPAARPDTGRSGLGRIDPVSTRTVTELIQARAQRDRDVTAVIGTDIELSLGEVIDGAAVVAERLRGAGVRAGTVVGLAADRSPQTVVAALGILTAGATCLPLDPAYPTERLRFMVEDSGAGLVLSEDPAVADRIGMPALGLEGSGGGRVRDTAKQVPDGVAWVLYTSGSTGEPKGVLIGHEMVVARLQREPIPWQPTERCCHRTSLSFIDSIWEMFGPLSHGLATVIADAETAADPRLLARLLERYSVTRIVMVPSLLEALLQLGPEDHARLSGVRHWISTGEQLGGPLVERFHRVFESVTLVNLYGATECWDVSWQVVPSSARSAGPTPIGGPLTDVRIWLLDDGLNPVPPNVPGELFVEGPCLSRGYLGKPMLTAAKFIPVAAGENAGLAYRTGDIACRRDDGTLELLGRRDLQVKVRGFRIELEEIERRLLAVPEVADAAVAPRRDESGSVTDLAAYVVPAPGKELDPSGLRRLLSSELPSHCLPGVFTRLDRMPLTPNGKLDRAALPAPEPVEMAPEPEAAGSAHVEPRTDTERSLAQIWSDVLGVEGIGATDNFFELGGNSLLAVQVVIRVEEDLGAEVPLRDFYASPTIVGLGEALVR